MLHRPARYYGKTIIIYSTKKKKRKLALGSYLVSVGIGDGDEVRLGDEAEHDEGALAADDEARDGHLAAEAEQARPPEREALAGLEEARDAVRLGDQGAVHEREAEAGPCARQHAGGRGRPVTNEKPIIN